MSFLTISLRYPLQQEMKNLNYLSDHILYHLFKIISSKSLKDINQ